MSLSTNITLTVNDYEIKLSRNLKFYENDQLKLIFTLNYWGIDNANGVTQKVLMPLNALSAVLFIETPLGVDSIENSTIENNVVTFYLTSNQTQHIGVSRMQMQLSDADGCQVTLPPMEFEVRENIYDNEVILSQVLLADENKNIVVSENGNAINTGTQVSAQTYAVALSAEDGTTTTTSQQTKQIKDFNLKTGVSGTEDLLIQDSDGVTKRIKSSEFLNVNIDLTLYYTKEEVNTLLNNKANVTHTHTISDIENMPDYALKTDIPTVPTKTSELTNDTGFITTIPTEYITESELNTELSTKANISDIPSLDGYATETFVTNKIAEASLSGGEVDLSGLATKDELATKADISSIPTKTSQLTNDSGFITSVPSEYITETELNEKGYLTEHQDISGKANISDLSVVATSGDYNDLLNKPTVINGKDGEDGATFIPSVSTNGDLSWTNNKGIENPITVNIKGIKGDKGDAGENGADGLTTAISLNGSTYTHVNGTITLPNYPTVPTNTSQLNNDSGYLTSIPSEYVTETELNNGLSSYQAKTDNTLTTTSKTIIGAINELNRIKIVALTQSEYDGLSTKDSNTVYLITD